MVRPFRFEPSALPLGAIARPRLAAAVAQRWERRLVTVVAGPGFGKSSLLASAVRDPDRPAGATDIWLSCGPADADADHLRAALATALDAPLTATVPDLCDRIWSEAPDPKCLVLDDVHEIPPRSSAAALLAQLLSDLPGNGHLLLASREPVPIPVARLAAAGQVARLTEQDLLFTDQELLQFASARSIDPALLRSTGGWPALAELTASAGSDLVLDYLWQEVLERVGPPRARTLAKLALVGGADDVIATTLAGSPTTAADVVRAVPLVVANVDGWVSLHPLWQPALQGLLDEDERDSTLREVARLHLGAGRADVAANLMAEAGAWDDLLVLLREVMVGGNLAMRSDELAAWGRRLPDHLRRHPAALMAEGLALAADDPHESLQPLRQAALGFRALGDVDGELTAMSHEGIVRWWEVDLEALLEIHARIQELAEAGSATAGVLAAVGLAGVAHLMGDSDGVLSHLDGVDELVAPQWLPTVQWLRSVAHRRRGELAAARRALRTVDGRCPGPLDDPQHQIALLRADWLDGQVDRVRAELPRFVSHYERTDAHRLLAGESALELATKAAWLGESDVANALIESMPVELEHLPLGRVLHAIASAAVAVSDGDEEAAATTLRTAIPDALEGADRWYWRDRLAIALTHVLVPETRPTWAADRGGPPHRFGVPLAEALEAARSGDLSLAAALDWPPAGVVRANLPLSWVAELAAYGAAARNPPSPELLEAVGPVLRPALRNLVRSGSETLSRGASDLLATLPSSPGYHLRIEVLGPLAVYSDGRPVDHPELRRRRVRELLCQLVLHRQARREAVADELWPDIVDPGRNLRVTLSYLQQVLQPERSGHEPPYFVRSSGPMLTLTGDEAHLSVDAWELTTALDRADSAEHAGDPTAALVAYATALPLWRGEPYTDAVPTPAVHAERARLVDRYVAAAVRAGELFVAAGNVADARAAAERALGADPAAEPAYRLLARTHLADGDQAAALRVIDRCALALATLDAEPTEATRALVRGG